MYVELRHAIDDLSLRGLFVAARWAAEQLNGLDEVNKLSEMAVSVSKNSFEDTNDACSCNPSFMLAKAHFEFKVITMSLVLMCRHRVGPNIFCQLYLVLRRQSIQ
jgi:hypothetical protein